MSKVAHFEAAHLSKSIFRKEGNVLYRLFDEIDD